jgi:hypothetical protein
VGRWRGSASTGEASAAGWLKGFLSMGPLGMTTSNSLGTLWAGAVTPSMQPSRVLKK